MLKIRLLKPAELSEPEVGAWRDIQESDPDLQSPFFSPEFTKAVGSARTDAFVAVVERNHTIQGFLPFQRRKHTGRPIGATICDYQGLICKKFEKISAAELLDGCRLDAFDFNHVPTVQAVFHQHSTNISYSPFLDLSEGYPNFLARRKANGAQEVAATLRKQRKAEREIGPIRFVLDDSSDLAWQNLIAWKNAQYKRTNVVAALDFPWIRDTLTTIRAEKGERFSGLLSSLYAGDRLLAVHFGIRSQTVWHYWFPAYDMEFHRYSAGLILLLRMAELGASAGIRMIDLGRGRARYKSAFADGEITLCEGSIERPASIPGALRLARKAIEHSWSTLPVGSAKDWPRRLFNRLIWHS